MVEIDANIRLPILESSGVCQEIANDPESRRVIEEMVDRTVDVERGVIFYKIDGNIKHTDIVKGKEPGIIETSAITSENEIELRKKVIEIEGVEDANIFYEDYDWIILAHTHPGGDPSPSAGDIGYILEKSDWVWNMQQEYGGFHSTLPVLTGVMAVSREKKRGTEEGIVGGNKILITGFTVSDNLPSLDWIEYYQDQARSLKVKTIPRFYDSEEEKKTHKERRIEAYHELIEILTEGDEFKDPILNRCHAVIEDG